MSISVFGFGGAGLRSVHINHAHPELMTSHCHSYFPNRPVCHTADGPTAVHLGDIACCCSPARQDFQTVSHDRRKCTADVQDMIH